MFKTCTLALKKSWKNMHLVTPGSAKTEQKKDTSERLQEDVLRRDPRASATKNLKGGGEGSTHLERRSEEHGTLVAAHVFQSWPPDGHRRAYQIALTNSVHQYLATTAHGGDDRCRLWSGQLSQKASVDLSQQGAELRLSDPVQQLAWWLVGSRLASVDAAWAFTQLQHVQSALAQGAYQEDDINELLHSLTLYIYSQIKRLKSLHSAFPSCTDQSSRQLTYTLRTLQNLQSHPATRHLLDQVGQPLIYEDVVAALQRHAQDWWTSVLQPSQDRKTLEEQLHATVGVTSMVYTLLEQDSKFYDDIFKKEMRVSHTAISYQEVSGRLAEITRPLLAPAASSTQEDSEKRSTSIVETFSVGSPLWSLYKNLGHIYSLGEHVGGHGSCGPTRVHGYPGYFMGTVAAWLTHTQQDTHLLLQEGLLQDTFHPDAPSCSHSPSLQELLRAFRKVRKWWEELAWPEAETCGALLVLVLETLCSLATAYCQGLPEATSSTPSLHEFRSNCFDVRFCTRLANMSRAIEEVKQLADDFGLNRLLEKVRRCSNSGAASQVKTTVETLVSSATHNLETILGHFIETNIDMVKLKLSHAVQRVCEEGSIAPLVDQMLHPTLAFLQEHLHPSIFQRLLLRLWDALLVIFMVTVAEKSEKRPTDHFSDVYCLLESTFSLFTDYGNLDRQMARTPGYKSLLEQLEEQRVPTVKLITQYYETRYLEQTRHHLPITAHILVRIFFSQPGRLTVRVFDVRDMAVAESRCSSRSQPHYFVLVQVVPRAMFPSAAVCRTCATKEYPPSFDETFEFPSGVVTGESSGLLQLILMHRGSCGGTFLGEALMPLSAVPYLDSPEVQNTCLRMTAPCFLPGYKPLILLQSRVEDELAVSFIKMIERQHPQAKNIIKTRGEGYHRCQ